MFGKNMAKPSTEWMPSNNPFFLYERLETDNSPEVRINKDLS